MTRGALALFLLVSVLLLGTLGVRPLYKADESRYAEIPREMVASGDWLTPRLNAFKYFEKPPLQYWATAVFFEVFGERDWVARLWTTLAGLGGIALVFFAGRKLFGPEAGLAGAWVLAGSPLYVLLSQVNTLDMALSFFLSLAIFAFALERYYVFWAACAFAALSKGLIGIVLPAGAIGLYVLVRWDWGLLRRMKIVPGLLLFFLVSAPWFVLVSRANPEFFHFFFIQEHFERFTTKMHGRFQPWWYFLPILAVGFAPWLLPLLGSWRRVFERSSGRFDARLFFGLWIAVVFVFFSISDSKLPSYILPLFPPLAVLVGAAIAAARARGALLLQALIAAAAGIALALMARTIAAKIGDFAAAYVPWLVAAGGWLALVALAAAVAAWRGKLQPSVTLLSLASFGCVLAALVGHASIAPAYTIEPQASRLDVPPEARIFAVDLYDHTLPWTFRRTVTMVSYKDELAQAIGWEPQKFIPDLAGFERAWGAAPQAYAVFASQDFPRLQAQLAAPMEVVSRGPRYTIVRKP